MMAGSLLLLAAAASGPEPGHDTLARALACQIDNRDIAGLMTTIAGDLGHGIHHEHSYGAPSGAVYRLDRVVSALGYSAQEIYVQPGRIALVVPGPQAALAQALQLEPVPFGPDSRQIGGDRSIVAWSLHQDGLEGKVLVGCEYLNDAAGLWLDQIESAVR